MQVDAVKEITGPDAVKDATDSSLFIQASVADWLYLLVLAGAAVIRFVDLGGIPLAPAEASEALAAWQFLQPGAHGAVIGSPAYFTLTSLLMGVLGASDTVARLVPATFGLGLVALPWFMRGRLGAVGTLVCAAFLAASPLNSTISRTAGGDAIALFAVLLFVTSVVKLRYGGRERWTYGLAIALGLGLASSALFYGGLVTLVLAWLLASIVSKQPVWRVAADKSTTRNSVILGSLVFVGLSTRILTYPSGIGASAQLLGDWLSQFSVGGGLQSALAPFLALARYEIALLVSGIVAVVWAIWKNKYTGVLLTFWLLSIFGLMLLQGGILSNALLVTLAGYLLVGLFSATLFRKRSGIWTWILSGVLLLIGAILLVNVARYLRVSVYEQDLSNLWLGILALAGAALVIYYFWSMTDAGISQAVWLAMLILLLIFEWGTAWRLSHDAANDPRERWVETGTDNDLPVLLSTLQDVSRQATNSDAGLNLLSAVDTPVLRWYLRDFRQAVIGQAVPPDAQQQAIVSLAGEEDPQFGADYIGSDFGLMRWGTALAPESAAPFADLLRWWLFQETAVEMIEDRIILWIRSDMVLPQQ